HGLEPRTVRRGAGVSPARRALTAFDPGTRSSSSSKTSHPIEDKDEEDGLAVLRLLLVSKDTGWAKLVPVKFVSALLLCVTFLVRSSAAGNSDTNLTVQQRLETQHLQAVHETRLRFARERMSLPNLGPYEDFRAVIHVHAEDS